MNKSLLIVGFIMISLEILFGIVVYLSTQDLSWITTTLVMYIIGGLVLVGYNVCTLLLLIYGIVYKENKHEKY